MAQSTFVPVALLLGAKPAAAGGLPSPTNQDDMEKRKMAREEMLKAARAKAAAQAAAEAPPPRLLPTDKAEGSSAVVEPRHRRPPMTG